jgi:hypothetical protein
MIQATIQIMGTVLKKTKEMTTMVITSDGDDLNIAISKIAETFHNNGYRDISIKDLNTGAVYTFTFELNNK